MRRFRFHLGAIVILIPLLAIGFAALRESNEIWTRNRLLSLSIRGTVIS
jgi:hypothetical protein